MIQNNSTQTTLTTNNTTYIIKERLASQGATLDDIIKSLIANINHNNCTI